MGNDASSCVGEYFNLFTYCPTQHKEKNSI